MEQLKQELQNWLRTQFVSSDNIGDIRRQLFVPWHSTWNTIVRDETAARENIYPEGLGEVTEVVTDRFTSPEAP